MLTWHAGCPADAGYRKHRGDQARNAAGAALDRTPMHAKRPTMPLATMPLATMPLTLLQLHAADLRSLCIDDVLLQPVDIVITRILRPHWHKVPAKAKQLVGELCTLCHWPQPQLTVTSHAQSRVTHESRVSTTHASRLLTLSQAGGTCHTSQQAYLGRYGGTGKGQRPLNPRTPRTEAHSSSVARAHFHLNSPSQFVICSGRCAARRLR
jgi:hypothetical protein